MLAARRQHVHAAVARHVQAPFRIDGHAVAAVIAVERAEIAAVGRRAVATHVEREHVGIVRHVQRAAVRAQHDAVRADVLVRDRADDAVRIDVEGAADREVRAALAVGDQVVQPAERRAVGERHREHLALGQQLHDRRQIVAARQKRVERLGAGALDGVQPALRIERHGADTARRADDRVFLAVGRKLANRVRLLLREDHAAVGRADDAVGRLEIGPHDLPLRARRDDARESP